MHKITSLTLAISFLFLTSCASHRNILVPEISATLKNKGIIITGAEKPNFFAMTQKNMMLAVFTGGIAGFTMAMYDGNKIVKENNVEDPAKKISEVLSVLLQKKYQTKVFDGVFVTEDAVEKISNQYRDKADYALDVRTADWGIRYPVKGWYGVFYSVNLRLIDLKTSKVIGQGYCSKSPSKDRREELNGHDELLSNDASILKYRLTQVGRYCTGSFVEMVFGVN
jgi:hypothetical protein